MKKKLYPIFSTSSTYVYRHIPRDVAYASSPSSSLIRARYDDINSLIIFRDLGEQSSLVSLSPTGEQIRLNGDNYVYKVRWRASLLSKSCSSSFLTLYTSISDTVIAQPYTVYGERVHFDLPGNLGSQTSGCFLVYGIIRDMVFRASENVNLLLEVVPLRDDLRVNPFAPSNTDQNYCETKGSCDNEHIYRNNSDDRSITREVFPPYIELARKVRESFFATSVTIVPFGNDVNISTEETLYTLSMKTNRDKPYSYYNCPDYVNGIFTGFPATGLCLIPLIPRGVVPPYTTFGIVDATSPPGIIIQRFVVEGVAFAFSIPKNKILTLKEIRVSFTSPSWNQLTSQAQDSFTYLGGIDRLCSGNFTLYVSGYASDGTFDFYKSVSAPAALTHKGVGSDEYIEGEWVVSDSGIVLNGALGRNTEYFVDFGVPGWTFPVLNRRQENELVEVAYFQTGFITIKFEVTDI